MDTTQPIQLLSNHIKPNRAPTDPLVLLCRCGNRTWFMRDDGYPECANCGLIQDVQGAPGTATWVSHAPLREHTETPLEDMDRASGPADGGSPSGRDVARNEVTSLSDQRAVQRRIVFNIERHWKLLVTNISLYEDGRSSVWCRDELEEIQTNDQLRDWYKARLEEAAQVILGGKSP